MAAPLGFAITASNGGTLEAVLPIPWDRSQWPTPDGTLWVAQAKADPVGVPCDIALSFRSDSGTLDVAFDYTDAQVVLTLKQTHSVMRIVSAATYAIDVLCSRPVDVTGAEPRVDTIASGSLTITQRVTDI